MAIYEYRCSTCDKTFEVRQSFKDEPLTSHHQHQSGYGNPLSHLTCFGSVERVIPRSSFQLKGGGWFKDGYGSTKK